jgi:hypothetical protein
MPVWSDERDHIMTAKSEMYNLPITDTYLVLKSSNDTKLNTSDTRYVIYTEGFSTTNTP